MLCASSKFERALKLGELTIELTNRNKKNILAQRLCGLQQLRPAQPTVS